MFRKLSSLKNKLSRRKTKTTKTKETQEQSKFGLGIIVVVVILLLTIIFGALVPFVRAFYLFETQTSFNVIKGLEESISEKKTIALIGLDKKESHVFVDALTILVVDHNKEEVAMINISPDILSSDSSGNEETLRRSLIQNTKEIQTLLDQVSNLLAININQYIAVDRVYFENMGDYTESIVLKLPQEVVDEDVVLDNPDSRWADGPQGVASAATYDFLRSDSNGNDDKLLRQLNLYREYPKSIVVAKTLFGASNFFENLTNNLDTNMSKLELTELFLLLFRTPSDSTEIAYTREELLVGLGKVGVYEQFYLNTERFDKELELILSDDKIALEQSVVEVLNASGKSGFANSRARWLQNSGMNVIHVGNAPFEEKVTTVYVESIESFPNTINRIREIFGDSVEVVESKYPYKHIGEIVIVLGSDEL